MGTNADGSFSGNNGRQGTYIKNKALWDQARQFYAANPENPPITSNEGGQAFQSLYDGLVQAITPAAGGGGGGVNPAQQAIQTLYSRYNSVNDGGLGGQLSALVDQARGAGQTALGQLQGMLTGQQNPYGQPVQVAQQAENPLAAYMAANGTAPTQVDAMRAFLQSQNADRATAGQELQSKLQQSWTAQQQGRQADAATAGASFDQMLATQAAAMRQQLLVQQQQKKDELMSQILQMAIQNGVDLSKLGVKF